MDALRNCPLCNGSAEQEERLEKCADDSYLKYVTIVCKDCGLTLFGCDHEENDNICEDEIKSLCDLWNNRIENRINDIFKQKQEVQNSYMSKMLFEKTRDTGDVAPKSEVERLEEEIETLKDNNEHLAVMLEEAKETIGKNAQQALEVTLEEIEKAKAEVARGIFEEIEKHEYSNLFGKTNLYMITAEEFAELKKKYMEEKKDEN